jgi:NAD+ kinase
MPGIRSFKGDPDGLDLFVTLGGDGTLLDAVAMVGDRGIPMLGLNLGRLGYLSIVKLEDTETALKAVMNGRFRTQERSLVQIDGCGDGFGGRNFALNEASVHKRDSSTMLSVQTHIDDRYLNTYWADGLIIATPTGSTAYSLSCGGPLLDPTCNAFVLTPIAAHNLNVRPFVVPDHHEIRLEVDPRGDKYLVNLDSRNVTLEATTELRIHKAPFTLKLIQPEGHDHLDTLRSKLAWGLDLRSGPSPQRTTE